MAFPLINPSHQWFDTSGAPLVSGTIEFQNPSTSAKIDTFPTADDADAQTNANANPLTLDSRGGFTGIYCENGVKYKVIIKDSDGAPVDTQDNVLTGSSELSDLTDVNTSTPTDKNVLVADGVDWESRPLVAADIADLSAEVNDLDDVVAWPVGSGDGSPDHGAGTRTLTTINSPNDPPDSGAFYGSFDIFDLANSVMLAQLGYTNGTDEVWIKNHSKGAGFHVQVTNTSGVARELIDLSSNVGSQYKSAANLVLNVDYSDNALFATGGADVALYYNNVEVFRTDAAADGGAEANNTATGGGFERVLTVSDLGGVGAVAQTISTTWARNGSSVETYASGSQNTYSSGSVTKFNDNAELTFGTGDDVAIDFDTTNFVIAGTGNFNANGFTDFNLAGRVVPSSLKLPNYTTAQLQDVGHAVNTSADKEQGVMVFDTTANIPMFATGNADASTWVGEKAGSTITLSPV